MLRDKFKKWFGFPTKYDYDHAQLEKLQELIKEDIKAPAKKKA